MTVLEIFNTTAVRSVEEQILYLYHETERNHWYNDENKKAIRSLLEVRKQVLNSMFVMNEHNKQLLAEFNEAMKQQMVEMRKRAIELYNNVYKPDMVGHIDMVGKCFMGYEYSKIHPVQTMRAKKMWAVLNGSLDDYIFLYHEDGVDSFNISSEDHKIASENEFLYLNEVPDNWNEGLERELTSDMHLTYAFHNLFSHLDFSIFDLLSDDYGDNLDWNKCDY